MTVLVEKYEVLERNASKLKTCHECGFVPAWEVSEHLVNKPKIGYACGQHLDTVVYLVDAGLLVVPKVIETNEETG